MYSTLNLIGTYHNVHCWWLSGLVVSWQQQHSITGTRHDMLTRTHRQKHATVLFCNITDPKIYSVCLLSALLSINSTMQYWDLCNNADNPAYTTYVRNTTCQTHAYFSLLNLISTDTKNNIQVQLTKLSLKEKNHATSLHRTLRTAYSYTNVEQEYNHPQTVWIFKSFFITSVHK